MACSAKSHYKSSPRKGFRRQRSRKLSKKGCIVGRRQKSKLFVDPALSRIDDEPYVGPITSLAIIFLLTSATCHVVWHSWGSISGILWLDLVAFFVASAVGFSAIWAAHLKQLCQHHEHDAEDLADNDSKYCTIDGISIHYKVAQGSRNSLRGIHMYHGFASNLTNWSDVQNKMAQRLDAVVTSHDMPGFGLSARPQNVSAYSLTLNGHIGRAILELESMMNKKVGKPSNIVATEGMYRLSSSSMPPSFSLDLTLSPRFSDKELALFPEDFLTHTFSGPIRAHWGDSLSQDKPPGFDIASVQCGATVEQRILIGHSMGCTSAALEAVSNPTTVSALILVAPAIPAMEFTGVCEMERCVKRPEVLSSLNLGSVKCVSKLYHANQFTAIALFKAFAVYGIRGLLYIIGRLQRIAMSIVFLFLSILAVTFQWWLLGAARSVARWGGLWEFALRKSFYQQDIITCNRIWTYRRPLYSRQFEAGFIPFCLSWLSMNGDGALPDFIDGILNPFPKTLVQKMSQAASEAGLKVLIVQGANDRLIPKSHGRRLKSMIPGAELLEYEECGHNPHEECPQKFVRDVARFANALS